jgi:hypothetical protein
MPPGPPGGSVEVEVDVDRETWIGIRIVEGLAEENLLDRPRHGLRGPGARQVVGKGLPDEAPEREASSPGGLRGALVELGGQQELCPAHVYEDTSG